MNLNQIKQDIARGGFTHDELSSLIEFTRSTMTLQAKASINVGDQVYVVQKTKRTLGTVEKVNIKKAIVNLPEGRYNVPLSMLEVA
jgi:hypothetical protein